MKKWKKYMIVVVGFFAITTLNAYQDNCCNPCCPPPPSCECPPCPPCCEIPAGPTTSAYNHPANINVCGCWDAYVTATFLWVLPSMEQLEFAITSVTDGIGKVHEFNFDWQPAFKVGLGYNFDHDNWDVYLQYTRINACMSNTHTPNSDEYLTNTYIPSVLDGYSYDQLKGKWENDFNTFDLEFGRPYYNGKCLQFRGHYGLKAGWIDNTFKVESTYESSESYVRYESKSWLIGPRAGIQTKWLFDDGFRFFGNAAASLFYQKFHKLSVRMPDANNAELYDFAYDFIAKPINAALESNIGIGWGTYFDRNNWHFDLAIGYEIQLFLNQNKVALLKDLANSSTLVHTKAGNYMFHGLNITMQFDF